jgi:hypothetical protein
MPIRSETNVSGMWIDNDEFRSLRSAVIHNPPQPEKLVNNKLAQLWAEANEPVTDPAIDEANLKDIRDRGMVPLGECRRHSPLGTAPTKTRKPRSKKTTTTDS